MSIGYRSVPLPNWFFFPTLMDKWNNNTGEVEAASSKFQAVPLATFDGPLLLIYGTFEEYWNLRIYLCRHYFSLLKEFCRFCFENTFLKRKISYRLLGEGCETEPTRVLNMATSSRFGCLKGLLFSSPRYGVSKPENFPIQHLFDVGRQQPAYFSLHFRLTITTITPIVRLRVPVIVVGSLFNASKLHYDTLRF
ncbi:unnamed protein product [Citrullus colocynthis]|uniref:Maturase K n=1 Tax=Citrullus colocynthis TaxID=252529 RepID=A0ABP0ZD93_9ROSI